MANPANANAKARDFLLEIGVEELPAAAAASAARQAGELALESFSRCRIEVKPEQIKVWVTPRRIAVFVEQLASRQQTEEIAERGPAAGAAFDDKGSPTKAAAGFAAAKNVKVGELEVREFKGQEFVFAVSRKQGSRTLDLLPEICRQIILAIGFPKTMRWDGGEMRFSRPVRWLVAKYGSDTVEFDVGCINSNDSSRGHRFLGGSVTVASASDYPEIMAKAKVIVDQEERRRLILEGLATEAGKAGARFIDPAGELNEVVYLVEYPSVHAGSFDERHLRLPDMVLITAMQSHQRYFPLTAEDGSLLNGFLYVMNGNPKCAAVITEGNERVLEGRIEDAEFSFDKDLSTGIDSMVDSLGGVVFHQRLGSLADKSARLEALVGSFADMIGLNDHDCKTAAAAARLAKADQVSVMVHEFPTLEGYIGSVYAEIEGYPSDVCTAVAEQYLPASADGEMPRSVPGAVLAICDKVDNIMGAYSVDELPSGSRDPYGLRRAATGITEISNQFGFDFDLAVLLEKGYRLYINQGADAIREEGVGARAFEFVCDRIQHRLVEQGAPVEVVEAARASHTKSVTRLITLANALESFRLEAGFEDLHTAYFRSAKIASKAGVRADAAQVDQALFEQAAEKALFQSLTALEPVLKQHIDDGDYRAALGAASGIRPAVDRFFDDVLIMADDEKLRYNRLALLQKTVDLIQQLGDPMCVAAAPRQEAGSS